MQYLLICTLLSFVAFANTQSAPCQLAHTNDSDQTSTYQSGDRVQVSISRVCTCENGQFLDCTPLTEDEANVMVRPGVAAILEDNSETVQRPTDISRSFNQQLQDFTAEDFVFDFRRIPVESMGIGGLLQPVDLTSFPVVAMGNSAQSRFTLDPCGINLPHVHPRATEFAFVFKGSSLRVAFVHENGGGIFVNDITNNTSTLFPEGLIHYQQNTGCDTIHFMSTLNNADPGVVTITSNFFKLPVEGIAGSMDITPELATEIRDGLPLNIVRANEAQGQCQRTCGI